jgi:hypothetical protein
MTAARLTRLLATGLLGLAAALLVSCASSGKGLIPASAAGPLKNDFEEVQSAAESANGDCTATEAALLKTAEDFAALPLSVDVGLRNNLRQGIANLRVRAHEMCSQPSAQTTLTTTTAKTTTSTPTTTSTATTTPTTTTPTTPTSTAPATPGPGGGTPAPGESPAGGGEGTPSGEGEGGNAGAGGGVGAGGQEAGK